MPTECLKQITPPLERHEHYVFRYVDTSVLRLQLETYTASLLSVYLVISLPPRTLNLLSITSILPENFSVRGPDTDCLPSFQSPASEDPKTPGTYPPQKPWVVLILKDLWPDSTIRHQAGALLVWEMLIFKLSFQLLFRYKFQVSDKGKLGWRHTWEAQARFRPLKG
jgi:hypothetical protein